MIKTIFFSAVSIVLAFSLSQAFADDAPSPTLIVNENGEALRYSPGGPLMGTVNKAVRVKKLDQKGDFIKVSVEGWIKEDAMSSESSPAKSGPAEHPALDVVTYEVHQLTKGETGDTARVQVKIKVKNPGTTAVAKWSAFLVVQNSSGREIVRSIVSGGDKVLQPGATDDLSFYWKSGEKEYDALTANPSDTLKISLAGISIAH